MNWLQPMSSECLASLCKLCAWLPYGQAGLAYVHICTSGFIVLKTPSLWVISRHINLSQVD